MDNQETVLRRLAAVIESRGLSRPSDSYTVRLLDAGVGRIGEKIREEAAELADASRLTKNDRAQAVIHEAADLIYHLMVMLTACDVRFQDVEAELARRFGTSGLEEKASRPRSPRAE
jgi:phosphoribosyl-ATP pyrophosphohydrolase